MKIKFDKNKIKSTFLPTKSVDTDGEISVQQAQNETSPFELNVDQLVSCMESDLWKAMMLLTRSKSDIRGTSKVNDPDSPASHV